MVWLDEFDCEFVVVVVVDQTHNHLAVAGQRLDKHSLSIDEGHLAIDRAIPEFGPAKPRILDDSVADFVECPVLILGLDLKGHAPLADHIGL